MTLEKQISKLEIQNENLQEKLSSKGNSDNQNLETILKEYKEKIMKIEIMLDSRNDQLKDS